MSDFRYNPLTGQFVPEAKTEQHTIEYMPEIAAYAVRVTDGIQLTTPRSVTVEEDGTGIPFAEQTARTAPNAGEFWVDYEATGFYGSGLILFNAADGGKVVNISYNGLGRLVTEAGTRTLIDEIFEDPVTFGGTVTAPEFVGDVIGDVTGNVTGDVTGNLTGSVAIPAGGTLTYDGNDILSAGGKVARLEYDDFYTSSTSGTRSLPSNGTWLVIVTAFASYSAFATVNGGRVVRFDNMGEQSAVSGHTVIAGSSYSYSSASGAYRYTAIRLA